MASFLVRPSSTLTTRIAILPQPHRYRATLTFLFRSQHRPVARSCHPHLSCSAFRSSAPGRPLSWTAMRRLSPSETCLGSRRMFLMRFVRCEEVLGCKHSARKNLCLRRRISSGCVVRVVLSNGGHRRHWQSTPCGDAVIAIGEACKHVRFLQPNQWF